MGYPPAEHLFSDVADKQKLVAPIYMMQGCIGKWIPVLNITPADQLDGARAEASEIVAANEFGSMLVDVRWLRFERPQRRILLHETERIWTYTYGVPIKNPHNRPSNQFVRGNSIGVFPFWRDKASLDFFERPCIPQIAVGLVEAKGHFWPQRRFSDRKLVPHRGELTTHGFGLSSCLFIGAPQDEPLQYSRSEGEKPTTTKSQVAKRDAALPLRVGLRGGFGYWRWGDAAALVYGSALRS
jgi:hypothetical protein